MVPRHRADVRARLKALCRDPRLFAWIRRRLRFCGARIVASAKSDFALCRTPSQCVFAHCAALFKSPFNPLVSSSSISATSAANQRQVHRLGIQQRLRGVLSSLTMDFMSDALFDGKRFRALTVVDAYTRECLAIHVNQGIKGEQVVSIIDRLLFERGGAPEKIRVDNSPEFISRALDHWAYINRVTLDIRRPGKPRKMPLLRASTAGFATNV